MWTALLNYGYVGCIRDLFVDGQSKDIRRLAEAQRAVGVKPSCSREPPKQCLSNPCQHNGNCREGWNRYVCDCSGTGYLGRSCERGEKCRRSWRKEHVKHLHWTTGSLNSNLHKCLSHIFMIEVSKLANYSYLTATFSEKFIIYIFMQNTVIKAALLFAF